MKITRIKNNYKISIGKIVLGLFSLRDLEKLKDLIEETLELESQRLMNDNLT